MIITKNDPTKQSMPEMENVTFCVFHTNNLSSLVAFNVKIHLHLKMKESTYKDIFFDTIHFNVRDAFQI